ncbi:hypothetical protein [Sodalis sp. RH16]|uniref:hypothetical protein n=1 Tax=unclassified Sodalis (in: enterobacteria) TaxID=2636512 RepID=UPI0039B572BA
MVAINYEPETIQLFASLAADTSVSANSLLSFIPVSLPTYEISSRIVVNNAYADDRSTNVVEFYLTYAGLAYSGQLILFVTGQLTTLVTTGLDGLYTAYVASSSPGEVNVRAEVVNNRVVFAASIVTFIPRGIYLGSNVIPIPAVPMGLGLQDFMSSLDIIQGHVYRIVGIPSAGLYLGACPEGYVYDRNTTNCRFALSDYTHLSTDSISPVLALRSGLGQDLRSAKYYQVVTARTITVQIFDEGPA